MKAAGNIDAVIAELELKQAEIGKAITDLKKLRSSGLLEASISSAGVRVSVRATSAYKLAVDALRAKKQPLVMRDLVDLVLKAGYTSKSKEPHKIVNTSLYKSISGKKRCELIILKDGRIGLRSWK